MATRHWRVEKFKNFKWISLFIIGESSILIEVVCGGPPSPPSRSSVQSPWWWGGGVSWPGRRRRSPYLWRERPHGSARLLVFHNMPPWNWERVLLHAQSYNWRWWAMQLQLASAAGAAGCWWPTLEGKWDERCWKKQNWPPAWWIIGILRFTAGHIIWL